MATAPVAMEIVMCERSVSRTQTEGFVRITLCFYMTCLTGNYYAFCVMFQNGNKTLR